MTTMIRTDTSVVTPNRWRALLSGSSRWRFLHAQIRRQRAGNARPVDAVELILVVHKQVRVLPLPTLCMTT